LSYKDGTNQWTSPVVSQSNRLAELLRTRAFVDDVAQRTSLAPLTSTTAGENRVMDLVTRGVTLSGSGASEHLLIIRVQAPTAQVSFELAKAIVDAYQEKTAADQSDQAGVAVDFFQQRVDDTQAAATKASSELRRYVTARQLSGADTQAITDTGPDGALAALMDPKLANLQNAVQQAQLDLNNAQSALKQAQQDSMVATQGQQYGFQVLDPPQLPTAPVSQLKKIIIYPIAAVIVGLGLSAMLLVLLLASDRSIRTEADLPQGLRALGSLPRLQLRNVPKKLRDGATRRAIGAPIGAALPASGGTK
jgi:hypothetical protein